MTAPKKTLAALLAILQIAWSFSWGATSAVAQVVGANATTAASAAIPVLPASAIGSFSTGFQSPLLPQTALGASLAPTLQPTPTLAPSVLQAAPVALDVAAPISVAAPDAVVVRAHAHPVALTISPLKATPTAATALSVPHADAVVAGLRRDAPVEDSSRAGAESFSQIYSEKLVETGRAALSAAPVTASAAVFRARPLAAAAKSDKPRPAEPSVPEARAPAQTGFWSKPAVRVAAGVAAAAALAAAAPLLAAHAAVLGAAGSVVLSAIGLPQIWKNHKSGKSGVKDLAIASPLIWFSAATMLSVVSIGQGSSLWWNAANLAGVVESAVVVGQINAHKRDARELKTTALTALATLAPLPLVAAQVFLPLSAWLSVSFAAAMGLLWVLNWPQIRLNDRLFRAEGRAPQGIAPLYPALVVAGSLLHLFAAFGVGDMRWAINAVVGILTASLVLAQIYAPRAAHALLGPAVKLVERLLPGKSDAGPSAELQAKARALVAGVLPDLSRHAAKDGGAAMARALERAKALPGRSVVFLEAPTAAGKSTLAEGLKTTLGARIKVFPVDRYFKPKAEVPLGPDGQPDFDRPESLYLDRVAADMKTLLAGGRVELPLNDMATQTTRFDSGEFLTLGAEEVLIVDSIYASHEKLLAAAEGAKTLNLYLDAPAVVRLARRLRRDRVERGISAEINLTRWPVILRDEAEFIRPLKRRADIVVNLIQKEELGKLADTYGSVLAAEWAAHGENAELTARFLAAIKESLAADRSARPLRLLITGPPGSGKSTFGKMLARDYGMIHVSVGELLRAKAAADPALAAKMAEGELVDSALVREVVLERLSRSDVQADGFILDGFPRRPEEISVIESWLKEGNTLDGLVHLSVSDAELQRRVGARGRADDTPEVFARRMEIYRAQTQPVLEHFRGSIPVLEAPAEGADAQGNYAGVRGLVEKLKNAE